MAVDYDVHVFPHTRCQLAFDARNYNILQLDEAGAVALREYLDHADRPEDANANSIPLAEEYTAFFRKLENDSFFSTEPLRPSSASQFSSIVIMLAGGCNMGCSYCFEQNVPIYQAPNKLTREMADKILDWFFKNHQGTTAHVEFYGGEPLLAWDILVHIVARLDSWSKERAIPVSKYLITNGTFLDDRKASFLQKHDVVVQVSIDGDRETHDAHRSLKNGSGTFERVVRGIHNLKDAGVNFNLRAVATRKNPRVDNVMTYLESLGTDRVSFGAVSTKDARSKLSSEDWQTLLSAYRSYLRAKVEADEVPGVLRSPVRSILGRRKIVYGCGAGLSEVTVAPDGSIYECQRLMGNPIGAIDDHKSIAELGSTFLVNVDDRPQCKECFARYICGGGCKEAFVSETGRDEPFTEYCQLKRLELEEAISIVAQLKERPGLRDSLSQPARNTTSCA